MALLEVIAFVCLILLLYYFITAFFHSLKCDLPGPFGVPFLGYAPFLGRYPYVTFLDLHKKYGDIFQVQLGRQRAVVLGTAKIIHEAYAEMAFTGRPDLHSLRLIGSSGRSRFVVNQPNARWRFLRRTAAKSIGLFASSKNSKLQYIMENAEEHLSADLDKQLDRPIDPHLPVLTAVAEVVGSILFGVGYDRNNSSLLKIMNVVDDVTNNIGVGGIVDTIPYPDTFVPGRVQKIKDALKVLSTLAESQIENHSFEGGEDDIKDVLDALFSVERSTPAEEKRASGVQEGAIPHIASDLFAAGFNNTADMFLWIVNLNACFPHVQEKLQEHLDRVIQDDIPRLEDKPSLPYVEAVVAETLRFATLSPFGLPHAMTEDTVFHGYKIPKGMMVIANFWLVHHDESLFPQPYEFKPDRFILEDGKFNMDLTSKTFPFGSGRRRCVGENLARQELFLLTASIFQRYSVRIAPGVQADPHDAHAGFTRAPSRWPLIFTKRKQ